VTKLFAFFGSLATTLPSRILAALGIGFISSAGLGVAVNSLVSQATSSWSGLSGVSLQMLSLAGFTTGFGMILGAMTARAALTALTKLGKLAA